MSHRCEEIRIDNIPADKHFQGYLWYSNQHKPQVLTNEPIPPNAFTLLPFVVEGNLWNAIEKVSYKIRFLDGDYRVWKYDLKHTDSEDDTFLTTKTYQAHDIHGVQVFTVVHGWQEVEDELLENMKTLVPAWTAFTGFKNY